MLNLAGLAIALLAIFAVFSFLLPHSFPTVRNLETLAAQSTITILVALGMTFVIVSGGIDLSVGSVAAFAGVVIAATIKAGWSPLAGALAGVLAGALAGLLNGLFVNGLKVGPFIVTLGTLSIMRGAAKGIAHEQEIYGPDTWLENLLREPGRHPGLNFLPSGVWLTVGLAILCGLVLRYTRFGRHVIAVGSNEQASRLCGVPIAKIKLAVYALSGLFAGMAGLMYFSRLTVGDPTVAVGLELDAIAAVVIGGASLNGGEGTILGSVLGALIMTTLRAGASQLGLSNWVQEIVTGGIIILAVALDRARKRT